MLNPLKYIKNPFKYTRAEAMSALSLSQFMFGAAAVRGTICRSAFLP